MWLSQGFLHAPLSAFEAEGTVVVVTRGTFFLHPTTPLRPRVATECKCCLAVMGWQQYSLGEDLESHSSSPDCISASPVHS